MIANWYGKDKLNKKGLRNLDTTNRHDFNCGGYALETFNWYQPTETIAQTRWFINMEDVQEVIEQTVACMLKEFKGALRIIGKIEDLKEDEYAIAYRISEDGDFHFAKRSSKGVWFHKRGSNPIIERMTKEEVFGESWGSGRLCYDSEIVLLAKKKFH